MRKCVCSRAFLMSFFCTVLVLLLSRGTLSPRPEEVDTP